MEVPYSGPPSYETLFRRFSSHPNPLNFFAEKRWQEAKERGEYFDIHDAGRMEPDSFDVLITDLNDRKFRSEISQVLGIQYHTKATEADANNVVKVGQGIIYGHTFRTIFPCVVSYEDKAHWVFFIVDSGAPLTYLSSQVSAPTYGENTWPLT